MRNIFPIIFMVMLVMSLTGCHRNTVSSTQTADSTEIKQIEEMQERGSGYRNSSEFESAIATHDSCIQMAEEINDTIQLVIALNNQGTNYRRLSANKEAADYHFRALQLCDAYSDTTTFLAKKNRVRSLNGIGNVMLSLGNYEAAESAFRSALAGETRLNSATGQAINLANIGSIKESNGELDSARIYYTLSMEKNLEADNMIGISLCHTYLGGLDKKAGKISDAIVNFRQAYAVGSTTGDIWHELTPCLSLAQLYTEQNATDSAYKYINIGIKEAKEIHSNEHLRDFYAVRSQLEEKQGNVVQSLADLRLCTSYNDSILSEEERSSVQNARANYESSRRSAEVKAANEEAKTSRIIRNAVAVTAILIVLFMVFAFWQYRRYMRMRHKAEQEREILVRNIAHNLCTPMSVVTGLVELLKKYIPEDDPVGKEDIAAAERQTMELQNLIKQLASKDQSDMASLLDEKGDVAHPVDPPLYRETSLPTIESAPHPWEAGNGASILLAEDNDDVAMMICSLLREHGYNVNRAADGQEALDMLQQGDLPDLLITDIAMPRMDGLELMRQVRADDTMCHLPIIVASARVKDSERMEGISAGAEVYLTKPFIPRELILRVSTLLYQRERLRNYFSQSPTEQKPDSPTEQKPADKQQPETTDCNPTISSQDSPTQNTNNMADRLTITEKELICRLNRIIDDNMLKGSISVNFIADSFCVSASTINRKVKNITGMSCSDYVLNRKIEHAKRQLADSTNTIAEIAHECGFEESTHFTRSFKRLTGITPKEFRHNLQ